MNTKLIKEEHTAVTLARIFLLVDLRDFFSDLGSWGRKKINKKALKMTSQLVIKLFSELFFFFFFHFQSFFIFFIFIDISRKTVKLVW